MKNKKRFFYHRLLFYILGLLIMSVGSNLFLKAALGVAPISSYERLFLCEHVVQQRSAIYISSKTKEKLSDVVRRLGWSRISVTSFAENILAHHLELFRDEINRLHRQKNTKDIL